MKKIIFLTGLLINSNIFLYSADNEGWRTWCENFLKSLKYKAEKKISPNTKITAVAAVRGNKAKDNSNNVYWKGSDSEKAKQKINAEKNKIKEAIETALNGDIQKARQQLKDFIEKNPDSYFINEAKEALEKLPEEDKKEIKPLEKQGNTSSEKTKSDQPVKKD